MRRESRYFHLLISVRSRTRAVGGFLFCFVFLEHEVDVGGVVPGGFRVVDGERGE
jgi:hypothetical protein